VARNFRRRKLNTRQWLAALDVSRETMDYVVEHYLQEVLVLERVIGALTA
jgi:hypothetical protein